MVKPTRFFGLDIHKFFMVAVAVDADKQIIYGPRRVEWPDFERRYGLKISPMISI